MAYAYSQIDQLMQDQGNKQNIFGQATQPINPTDPSQNQGAQTKTSLSGSVEAAPAGGGSSSPPVVRDSGQSASSSVQANQAALSAANKSPTPKAVSDVSSQIQKAQGDLGSQGQAYVDKGYANQDYSLGSTNVGDVVRGKDQAGEAKIQDILGRSAIKSVDPWAAPNVSIPDAGLLKNDAGLSQLVSRGQGGRYTPGMAAFDVQSLKNTPGFADTVRGIQSNYQGLQDQAQAMPGRLQGQVETYGKQQLSAGQQAIKDQLAQEGAGYGKKQAQAASDWDHQQDLLRKLGAPGGEDAQKQARASVLADYQQNNPLAARYVNQSALDSSKFATINPNLDASAFISPEDASGMNEIYKLLGRPDVAHASQALPERYSYDQPGMEALLHQETDAARAGGLAQDYKDRQAILDPIQAQLDAANKADIPGQAAAARAALSPDLMKYYSTPEDVFQQQYTPAPATLENFISGGDATRLNRLNADIGPNERADYTAGSYKGFDKAGYQKALGDYLAGKVPSVQPNDMQYGPTGLPILGGSPPPPPPPPAPVLPLETRPTAGTLNVGGYDMGTEPLPVNFNENLGPSVIPNEIEPYQYGQLAGLFGH